MALPTLTEPAAATLEKRTREIANGRLSCRVLARRGSLATVLLLLVGLPGLPVAVLKAQPAPAPESPDHSTPAPPAREPRGGRETPAVPTSRPTGSPQPERPASPAPRFGGRGGFGSPAGFGSAAAPSPGEGPTCKLDATIYDVRLPVNQIGKLDVDALTEASATADAFEKALTALGTAQPLYRANQSVRLSGDTITIGSEVPIVTSSRLSEKGQTINTIQYMSTGALFTLAGKVGPSGGIDLDLGIQLSAISDGAANLTDNVKASVMRKATLSHKGPVQAKQSFVVISVDGGSTDKDGKAVAYIGRITLGEPQPAAPK